MRDTQKPQPEDGGDQRITLIAIKQSYWLAEGVQFLDPMLVGDAFFPTPVRCIKFSDHVEFRSFVGHDLSLNDLWGINPKIVARLRRNGQLLEMKPRAE